MSVFLKEEKMSSLKHLQYNIPVVPPSDKIQLITCIVPQRDINIKWLQKVFFFVEGNGTTFSYLSLDIMSTHNSIFFYRKNVFMLEKHFYIESFEYIRKNYFTKLCDDEVEM